MVFSNVEEGFQIGQVPDRPLASSNTLRNIGIRHAGCVPHEHSQWAYLFQELRSQRQILQTARDVLAWVGNVFFMILREPQVSSIPLAKAYQVDSLACLIQVVLPSRMELLLLLDWRWAEDALLLLLHKGVLMLHWPLLPAWSCNKNTSHKWHDFCPIMAMKKKLYDKRLNFAGRTQKTSNMG